jgi:hypothetical protein
MARNDDQDLTNHLRAQLKKQGIFMDKYDPDFIMGVLMEWLRTNDAALTSAGVRRFKLPIMGLLLDRKFTNERLAHKLLETGDAVLIEGNYWHDNEWGDCRCKDRLECQAEGQNLLGLELMRVRGEIALEYAA